MILRRKINEKKTTNSGEIVPFNNRFLITRDTVDHKKERLNRHIFITDSEFKTVKEIYKSNYDIVFERWNEIKNK